MGEKRQSVDEDDCGYDDVVFARDVHCNSVCTSFPACTVGSILGLLDIRHSRHSPDGGDSVFVVFKDTGWHQKAFCTDRETIKPQCCGGDTLETRGRLTEPGFHSASIKRRIFGKDGVRVVATESEIPV